MITRKLSLKSALVSFSFVLFGALGFVACAAPVESGDETADAEEGVGEAQQAQLYYCCYGSITCSNGPGTWNYYSGPTTCGEITYNKAYSSCDAACSGTCLVGPKTCIPN